MIAFASKYIERLRELGELHRSGKYRALILDSPLVGCFVCAKVGDVSSSDVLEFDCANGRICRVHSDCGDYLLDESFLQSRERAVEDLKSRFV